MKQQMKILVAKEIRSLESEIEAAKTITKYFEPQADKADTSSDSQKSFAYLNLSKTKLRKLQTRLAKLVALQKEIKSMTGYMTRNL